MKFPTPEEIERVRVWECLTGGHDLDIVQELAKREPKAVVCGRCGGSWPIGQGLVVHDLSEEARREIAEIVGRERAA